MTYDIARGVTVLFGGQMNVSPYLSNDTWEWDGTNWTQRNPPTSPTARAGHAMTYDSARGVTVLFGGYNRLEDTWEWDGTNWTPRSPPNFPPGRSYHSMVYDSARAVTVIFGGFLRNDDNSPFYFNDTWEWNGSDWSPGVLVTMPMARAGHALVYDPGRGVSTLFGGANYIAAPYFLADTWEWNGTAWTQFSPATSPPARSGHAMAYDSARAETVVVDGYNPGLSDPYRGDLWAWNGSTWTQRGADGSPYVQTGHAMAYDSARAQTVLFGVSNNASATWEWGGTTWARRNPVVSPPDRTGHGMAFDSVRGVTVLFGGWRSGNFSDTWEWDGMAWLQRSPAIRPSGRHSHAMAFDSARGVTILFGGGFPGSNDTWEWNGTTWELRNPLTRPPGRQNHALVYDRAREVTVLFGGYTGDGIITFGDTWEWNGTNWTQRLPVTSPPAREEHALVYDSVRGVIVLYGGMRSDFSGFVLFSDMWEWNGTNWTLHSSNTGPLGRYEHAMAYDSGRGRTVLFGGNTGSRLADDTWEFGAVGPPSIIQQPADPISCVNGTAVITVNATGTEPLSYQWRKGGVNLTDDTHLTGSTTPTLTISPVVRGDQGLYDAVVTDACGSATSNQARLGICPGLTPAAAIEDRAQIGPVAPMLLSGTDSVGP
jgi:hypothetical protein